MNFFSYVVLGGFCYAAGWAVRTYILDKQPKPEQPYHLKHPTILGYLGAFFVIMLIVSWLIGRYLLDHVAIDLPFIIINSRDGLIFAAIFILANSHVFNRCDTIGRMSFMVLPVSWLTHIVTF